MTLPPGHGEPDFIAAWHANAAILRDTYSPSQEHDACGVGLIASL